MASEAKTAPRNLRISGSDPLFPPFLFIHLTFSLPHILDDADQQRIGIRLFSMPEIRELNSFDLNWFKMENSQPKGCLSDLPVERLSIMHYYRHKPDNSLNALSPLCLNHRLTIIRAFRRFSQDCLTSTHERYNATDGIPPKWERCSTPPSNL